MKWYVAKIVFHIINEKADHSKQFDEQIRLIVADGDAVAFNKAQHLGKEHEEIFLNRQQQAVQWKFINVAELYEINDLADGVELYSRIEEYDEPRNYVSTIHKKAANILSPNEYKIAELL